MGVVKDLCNPEWAPFWIDYKSLKRIIKDIVQESGGKPLGDSPPTNLLTGSKKEANFFRLLRNEVKKTADFFAQAERICYIRYKRICDGVAMLEKEEEESQHSHTNQHKGTEISELKKSDE